MCILNGRKRKDAVIKFIESLDNDIINNLKMILNTKDYGNISMGNIISMKIGDFCSEQYLKVNDIYQDVVTFVSEKYKNANLDLIEIGESENVTDVIQFNVENDPYYQYKNSFKLNKLEYID